jgi:hypothetical protein
MDIVRVTMSVSSVLFFILTANLTRVKSELLRKWPNKLLCLKISLFLKLINPNLFMAFYQQFTHILFFK